MVETSNRIKFIGDSWVDYNSSMKKVISVDDIHGGNMEDEALISAVTSELQSYNKVYDIDQIFRTFSLLLWRSWTETTRATGINANDASSSSCCILSSSSGNVKYLYL